MQFHSLVEVERLTSYLVLHQLVFVKSEKGSLVQGMAVSNPSRMLSRAAKKISSGRWIANSNK